MEFTQEADNNEIISMLLDIPREIELQRTYTLPTDLEDLFVTFAQNGELLYDWSLIQPLLKVKMLQILDKYFKRYGFIGPITETFDGRRELLMELVNCSEDPPFTFQRLCELIRDSSRDPTHAKQAPQYKTTHKLMNALEKLLSVSYSF